MNLLDNKDETELMKTNFTYPDPNDPDIQYKLYKKREFYYNKYPEQPEIKTYQDIKDYRDNICAKDFSLHEYQTLLANLINPDTPMRGAIVFHGLGTGKCILPGSKVNLYVNNKLVVTDILPSTAKLPVIVTVSVNVSPDAIFATCRVFVTLL